MAGKEWTEEETMNLLRDHKDRLGDLFTIKVWRANPAANETMQMAALSGAQLTHVVNPELWLPQLCGGGRYGFYVYHVSNPIEHIGGTLKHTLAGEPRAIDMDAPKRPGWVGPEKLDFPPAPQQAQPTQVIGAAPPLNPTSSSSQTTGSGGGGGGATDPRIEQTLRELNTQRELLANSQRQLDETRHKMELERVQVQNDQKLRDLEARLLAAQPKVTESPLAGIKELIAPLLGLFQAWMTGQSEMRQLMFKMDSERSQKSDALMMKMMERPAVDPLMMTLFDKLQGFSQSANPSAEMVGQMAELTMSMVDRAAEMANGQPESHWITAAREFAKAIGAAVGGMKIQKKPGQGQGQRPPAQALPPGAQRPAQGFQGIPGTPPGNGAGAVPTQTYQQPAPGVTQPQQAQAQPQQVEHQQPNGAPPAQPERVMTVIESLVAAVKSYAPVDQLAKAVITSVPDPGFQAELTAVDGSLQGLAAKYLADWVGADPQRNGPYVTSLLAAIEKEGRAAGVFEADDEGGDDDNNETDAETDQNE